MIYAHLAHEHMKGAIEKLEFWLVSWHKFGTSILTSLISCFRQIITF